MSGAEHEYVVWSVYKVTGEAVIRASSAAEAVEKGLSDRDVKFFFSDPHSETKMRAKRIRRADS